MITFENYEEYMMMHADGELTPHDEQDLMKFIKLHPELESELNLYGQLRFTPDKSVVFIDKDKLIKPDAVKKIIAFPVWLKYSIAAGIALLIFSAAFKFVNNRKEGNELAVKDTIKVNIPAKPDSAAAITIVQNQPKQLPVIVDNNTIRKHHVNSTNKIATVLKPVRPNTILQATDNGVKTKNRETEISSLPVAVTSTINTEPDVRLAHGPKDITEFKIQAEAQAPKSKLWNMLPMDDIKKKQLEHLAGVVAEAYTEISTPDDDETDKAVSVKLHKRKLTISF